MANDAFKIVAVWRHPNGDEMNNVMYARIIGGDAANVTDLITDVVGLLAARFASWLALCITTLVLEAIKVYAFDEATGVSTPLGTSTVGNAGTVVGDSLPGGCAIKITWFAPQRARPAGIYLPTPDRQALASAGNLSSTATASAASLAASLRNAATLGGTGLAYRPAYWSKKDSAFVDLVSASAGANDTVDYQRRRKAGVGI